MVNILTKELFPDKQPLHPLPAVCKVVNIVKRDAAYLFSIPDIYHYYTTLIISNMNSIDVYKVVNILKRDAAYLYFNTKV